MIEPIDILSSEEMFRRRVQETLENLEVGNDIINNQITVINSGSSTVNHSGLVGLTNDDHTQYLNTSRADTWFSTKQHSDLDGLTNDDHTQYLLANGTRDIEMASGEFRIGDGTNYTEFESDGTLEFVGDATVWDDLRIVPGSFDRPGTSDPGIVSYTPTGSSIAFYLYEFAKNNIASFTVQLPHNYKQGSNIYCHVHWTPGLRGNEENGATVGWKLDYTWANIDGTFGAGATLDLSDACDGTDDKHQMTPDVAITGTSKNISSMLICNIKRTDTGTDDTWASTTSGQLPLLLEIDFHYEIDTVGSRQRTAK